jgi:hypothetical protein
LNTYVKIVTLHRILRIYNETRGLGASFKSAYYAVRNPTIPTVRAVSRRLKLRICSANCVQYMCCVLARVANRELRNVVFKEHMQNKFPCQPKPNPPFTFHCTCVSGTPLAWLSITIGPGFLEVYERVKFNWCASKQLWI